MSAPARDTIFALSSGVPPAAIAIVRISGPQALPAMAALTGTTPTPRRATLAAVRDAENLLIDRALLLWFPGPTTATGEDLAELHLHGGRAIVAAVLAALGAIEGCRPAVAGEFTRRAFANGRLDLLEAQGLADLLAAETEAERRRAMHAAEGGLSRVVEAWRLRLLGLAARAEAAIEFGEEEDVAPDPLLAPDIGALAAEIEAAAANPLAERLRDGLRIVLCGPPNAGKSSLLNSLTGRAVAIASAIPGTTRDLIEAPVLLGGLACILTDSAGLRTSADGIEREGVRLAQDAIARADLLLWLGPPAACPDRDRSIIVRTKCDLGIAGDGGEDLAVSSVTGKGMAALKALLLERGAALLAAPDRLTFLEHQRLLLRECSGDLRAALEERDIVLLAERLRSATRAIDRLTGRAGVEDMLDALFGRFCIGK